MKRPVRILHRLRWQLLGGGYRTGPDLSPIPELEFRTSEAVRGAIEGLGRTEDLRFSPDNRWLAIAGFGKRKILLLRVRIEEARGTSVVVAEDFLEMTSDGIGRVHGIDFIDERTLVVANRDGLVTLLPMPEGEADGRSVRVEVIAEVRGADDARIDSPGSVAASRLTSGSVGLIVCNNYVDHVTRHVLEAGESYREAESTRAFERGLAVPDGVAVTNDGDWIAISSHYTHDVKVFPAEPSGRGRPKPAAALGPVNYPHGLRFTPDDAYLLVADAGSPFVRVFAQGEHWRGKQKPTRSVVVLDEATFVRGRTNPEEGGPKGLDIDRSGRVVAVTCEQQSLAFFPLSAFIG